MGRPSKTHPTSTSQTEGTAKPRKCEWRLSKLECLGMLVGGVIEVLESRVRAIREYKRLRTKNDIQRFLGTMNYYQQFIPNFVDNTASLTEVMRKKLWSGRTGERMILCICVLPWQINVCYMTYFV